MKVTALLVALTLASPNGASGPFWRPESQKGPMVPVAVPYINDGAPALQWEGAQAPEPWPGLGTPTNQCWGDGDVVLSCSGGLTVSNNGSPVAVAGTPWANSPGVSYPTLTDYTSITSGISLSTTSATGCATFYTPAAGAGYIMRFNPGTGEYAFLIYMTGGSLYVRVCSSLPSCVSLSLGAVAEGFHSVCGSYQYVGAGTSIISGALDGVSGTRADGPGPLRNDTSSLHFGENTAITIVKESWWSGTYHTPSTLASVTRQIWLRDSIRPPGTSTTWTRNAAQYGVCADGVTLCQAPANQPVCDWATGTGCYVWQGFVETLLQTRTMLTEAGSPDVVTAPWATYAAGGPAIPVLNIVSTTLPDGSTGNAFQADFPAINSALKTSLLYQGYTATAVPWTGTVYYKAAGANCTTYMVEALAGCVSGVATALNATSSWQRATVTTTATAAGWYLTFGPDGRCAGPAGTPTTQAACSVILWEANATATAVAMPPTTAVAGTVTVPKNAPVAAPRANPPLQGNRWTVAFVGTHSNWALPSLTLWQDSTNTYFTDPAATAVTGVGTVILYSWDAVNYRSFAVTHGLTTGEHDIRFSFNGNDARCTIDGVEKAVIPSGTGGGMLSGHNEFKIGHDGAYDYGFNGAIRKVKVCNGVTNPLECNP